LIHLHVNSLTLSFKKHRLSFAFVFGKRFITEGIRRPASGVRHRASGMRGSIEGGGRMGMKIDGGDPQSSF
jgi:hypothetical protein